MSDLIKQLAAKLPGRWDAIIGIPRGGLIVAVALYVEAWLDERSDKRHEARERRRVPKA